MDRILDISQDNRHLSRYRGFLVVSENQSEIGRVPLDEILAIIVHAHGITYTNSLLSELAGRGALMVICARNHAPIAIMQPIEGHFQQAGHIQAQWRAKEPLRKQLWKSIVQAKLTAQATVLEAYNHPSERVRKLALSVKSGDPENCEAQAARYYWPLVMGKSFKRDRNQEGVNALLNYGYTVLRAAVARAIIANGLHPSIGLHHHNKLNAFALADDLMEPFRPLVDCCVLGLTSNGINAVIPEAKRALAQLISLDFELPESRSPLTMVLNYFVGSLVSSFCEGKPQLLCPTYPSSLELKALGGSGETR